MRSLQQPLSLLVRHRRLIFRTVQTEVRQKYAGSILGSVWYFLLPALLLAAYVLLYLLILRVKPAGLTPAVYIVYLFSGLIPYLGISEGLAAGVNALVTNRSLLKTTVFPPELIPVRAVLASQMSFAAGMVVMLTLATFVGLGSASWILLLPIVLLQMLLLFGLAWILSLLNLLVRDISHAIMFALTVMLLLSPVTFVVDGMQGSTKLIVWMNPLTYFVHSYQSIVVHGRLPQWPVLAVLTTLSLGIFYLGFIAFSRLKTQFADHA